MPVLINKEKIKAEVRALEEHGYSVKQEDMRLLFDMKTTILSIKIIFANQNKGVIFIIPPDNHASAMTMLTKKDLAVFLENFPKEIAPSFAAVLEKEPPVACDVIKNDYDLNLPGKKLRF